MLLQIMYALRTVGTLAIVLALGFTFMLAQNATLQFEVASVRPSGPVPPRTPLRGGPPRGGPGTNDPERLTYERTLFQKLLLDAYGVQRDQIKGPDWGAATAVDGGPLFRISA